MPTKRLPVAEANSMRRMAPHIPTKRPSPNTDTLSDLEKLDENILLSLSLDAPARLTPSPGIDPLISEASPMPLSREQVLDDVMHATLDRLGFGPPNESSNFISPSPTPTNSQISTAEASSYEGQDATAEEPDPTSVEASADDMNAYASGQILRLFHEVAQRTGQSVNTIILEWALRHAYTDFGKRRAHGHKSTSMQARQQAFEEEANKVIELGTRLADVGIDLLFIMAGQNANQGVTLGKVWSTPGLQGMFKDLSLSDDDLLAAAKMHLYSSMWSRFCKKYKQDSKETPIEVDGDTTSMVSAPDVSSYIATQSAAVADAFLSATHQKGSLLPGPLSPTPSYPRSDSGSCHVLRRIKDERSAPSVLQDVLLKRD